MKQSGYIALLTTIIISSILLIAVTATASQSLLHRFSLASAESKQESQYLAEACIYRALVSLAYDKNYSGIETVSLAPAGSCSIAKILPRVDNQINILSQAVVNHSFSNTSAVVSAADLSILSWHQEP